MCKNVCPVWHQCRVARAHLLLQSLQPSPALDHRNTVRSCLLSILSCLLTWLAVNHFIGTTAGGHVFPGATLPWGSVKAGADCDSRENQAGYVADESDIRGFSPLHDDGTGGSPSLGQFKLMPMYCVGGTAGGQCDAQEGRRQKRRVDGSQAASPGYFKLGLINDVTVEITASHHAALYKFTFDKFKEGADEKPVIAFDLSNDLLKSFSQGLIHLEHENDAVRVSGWGEFRPSFGGGNYKVSM